MRSTSWSIVCISAVAAFPSSGLATAAPDPIKIGNTAIYSGPASSFGTVGHALKACFDKINAEGGINGRQVEFISRDDAYSPPKTVEQTRALVERDEVMFIAFPFGTATSKAVRPYLNQKSVPQLFVPTGSSNWNNPGQFPWTVGFSPTYTAEAAIYVRYALAAVPDAKFAVLYQNDDYGKEYLSGLRAALGAEADRRIARAVSYESTDATISSQIALLKDSGANVLIIAALGKFAAQAIKTSHEMGWSPLRFVSNTSTSRPIVDAAGPTAMTGVVSSAFMKDPNDPTWKDDPETSAWSEWMSKYYPSGNKNDVSNVLGWIGCQSIAHVVREAGANPSPRTIIAKATSLDGFRPAMILPGITMSTSSADHQPMKCLQPITFDGQRWQSIGKVLCEDR